MNSFEQAKYVFHKTGSIDEMIKSFSCSRESALSFATRAAVDDPELMFALEKYYSRYVIPKGKIVVVADTHLGRTLTDNFSYLYCAYEIARLNGVNNVIHLGDIIEGEVNKNNVYGGVDSIDEQINKIVRYYPASSDITTYYIEGNHDYNLDEGWGYFKNELSKKRSDLVCVESLHGYLGVGDERFFLFHDDYNLYSYPSLPFQYKLIGHGHYFGIDEDDSSVLHVQSLSPYFGTPGFVLLEPINEGYACWKCNFKGDIPEFEKDYKVLVRK